MWLNFNFRQAHLQISCLLNKNTTHGVVESLTLTGKKKKGFRELEAVTPCHFIREITAQHLRLAAINKAYAVCVTQYTA